MTVTEVSQAEVNTVVLRPLREPEDTRYVDPTIMRTRREQ
jgi:hypothetical protein